MPTKLGAADSFNSSGATIIPDSSTRAQLPYRQYNPVSTLSSARLLMPEDSFGRQLNEFMRNVEGENAEDQGARPQSGRQGGQGINPAEGEAILREFGFDTDIPSPLPYNPHAQVNASDMMSGLRIDPSSRANTSPFVSHSPLVTDQAQRRFSSSSNTPFDPTFRPSSAHSHRSSVSGSEFSYVSTEVSGDEDVRMDGEIPPAVQTVWNVDPAGLGPMPVTGAGHGTHISPAALGGVQDGAQYPSPVSTTGPSPPTVPGTMFGGPVRGFGREEEERQKKIEHRREINRRSAQKHRAARKAEVETLTRIIADRDARISVLERDLAVEKSKSEQMADFIRMSMGRAKSTSDASGSAESAQEDGEGSARKGSRRGRRESGA